MKTTLTKTEENKINTYLTKWLKNGRATKKTNKKKATEAMEFLYDMVDKKMPENVIFVSSPMEANLTIHKLKGLTDKDEVEVFYPTRSIHHISYYAHYDYVLNVLFPDKKPDFIKFEEFLKHSKNFFQCYMFDEVVIICDFPEVYNLNEQGQLHGDKKPSIVFRDGFKTFHLNGVSVTEEIANLDEKTITKELILKQENADIRREILRKLPDSKIVEILDSKVVDKKTFTINGKKTTYELLNIDINGQGRVRPFLKMKNPSLKNVYHIEGVGEDCDTVEKAIMFRNQLNTFSLPKELS
jgi:hypothetical protein